MRFNRAIDCSTQPPDAAVGRNVHDYMPAGRDGARIRSLMNEVQMLLHEHPVNQRRERAGQLPVNGWWIWGFGDGVTDGRSTRLGHWRVHGDDRWLRALAHALGTDAGDIATAGSDLLRGNALIALSRPSAQPVEEALASVDAGLLSMLASQVRAGSMQSLDAAGRQHDPACRLVRQVPILAPAGRRIAVARMTSLRRILRRNSSAELQAMLPATLHPVLRRVYGARPLAGADELALRLDQLLPVSTLDGAECAADLLASALRAGRRVLVVGDFDADGATSTALMMRQLSALGFAQPDFLVPDRFRFGYGLTPEIVRVAAGREPDLIVTVDNGISSLDGVEEARRHGIDVLVTDHHLPGRELPAAACIVNPNAPGNRFASKSLAGVGVAFYVMAALTHALRKRDALPTGVDTNPARLLDLVALGTVADVVTLDLNNRVLVAQGLQRIRRGRCVAGLRELLEASGRTLAGVTGQDLGFQAGPRLNAAGRLDDMTRGIRCLLADDPTQARALALDLARLNADRKELEAKMQLEAVSLIDARIALLEGHVPAGVCVYDEGWHQGVIGLVASRVKERLHRPVIAFARSEAGWVKGSARSVAGVHVRDVLDAIATRTPGLVDKFGGHAMAAGLTLREASLPVFEGRVRARSRTLDRRRHARRAPAHRR